MKITSLLLAALTGYCLTSSSQGATITSWTFETSLPGGASGITAATITGITPEVGSGTASGVHASSATTYSNPVGNGSTDSFSSNTWAVGDYYQFSTNTIGYEDITLSWAQTSSGTGPGEFTLAYSVNGGSFSNFLNYTVLPNQAGAPGLGAWNATTAITGYNFSADFSALSALDGAAVDFRLVMRSTADSTPPGTVAVAGTSRVDTFTVSGTAIPEPTSALLGGLGVLGLLRRRRR
jgi:hypothetical protein